ncbi:biotin-dependent carboxyltransferase family protein [Vannielia litorea]|uniref:5-oxoprolinase subunit C family protein n=1 Tax=Vannielia litorea TaxID=1217970 RepID=UPI001C959A2B|nr:biotin-dependent carboxyltransferase family protein [Vannielia litorea]MBY6048956.1 biotin-dependent carboxyltransferase family protein [Vannielia litorea]MBY6076370.1 biotin-dependent carboxyltransferase family protein [Vannielia litorea]
MTTLRVIDAGPAVTVQDMGRPGWTAKGLARGGAADRLALLEAAALLGQEAPLAALEMAGAGGRFTVDAPTQFCLTGARMKAEVDGRPVGHAETVLLPPGAVLRVGGAEKGSYGYLAFAGGVFGEEWLGSRAAHLLAGVGRALAAGDEIALGSDPDPEAAARVLVPEDRLGGGTVRMMPGPQTGLFGEGVLERFLDTAFTRAPQANRQGVRLEFEGAPFESETQGLASDFITSGDVQMTGDGRPYVLLAESQTVGGYPRIGTVITADLPRLAQAHAGDAVRFEMLGVEEADALWESETAQLARLRKAVQPRVRDPHDIPDLLGYQLVGGVTRGNELEE